MEAGRLVMTRCFFHIGLPFIFLVSFSVYLVTLNPTFQPDDSAETVAACATLTPQHPSGYPLYTLLGSLASHLPLGSEPFRVNLLATFLGALGVVFTAIYLFRAMILFNPENGVGVAVLSAFGGSLILSFSKTYWPELISAKGGIYILQSFIFLAAIYLIEKLDENPERNKAFCACPMLVWMLSLGSANGWEMLIFFCAAGLVYFLFRGSVELKKMELNAKNIIGMIALSLIGFSVYLLLPLRPGLKNIMVWGDTQSLRGFLHFFSDYDVRREMGLKWIKNMVHFSINQRDWNEAWNQIFRQAQQFNQISDHLTSDVGLWTWIPLILGVLY